MRFRCDEKIDCPDSENPVLNVSSGATELRAKLFCQERIQCGSTFGRIDTENPVMNLSSATPDQDIFISIDWGDPGKPPPLNKTFWQIGCLGWCKSTVSQEDADMCARKQWEKCADSPEVFFNNATSCTAPCWDGSSFTYKVLAKITWAYTQEQADYYAKLLACSGAYNDAVAKCPIKPGIPTPPIPPNPPPPPPDPPADPPTDPPSIPNTQAFCTAPCPDGSIRTFIVPAGMFFGATQTAADQLAISYACKVARINLKCNYDVWNNKQTYTMDCCNGGTQTKTVAAGTLGMTLLNPQNQADYAMAQQQLDALAYAQAKAQAQAACGWCNSTYIYTCPSGMSGVGLSVPAGQFHSMVSQADADRQAEVYAKNGAVCEGCISDYRDAWNTEQSHHWAGGNQWTPTQSGIGGSKTGQVDGGSAGLAVGGSESQQLVFPFHWSITGKQAVQMEWHICNNPAPIPYHFSLDTTGVDGTRTYDGDYPEATAFVGGNIPGGNLHTGWNVGGHLDVSGVIAAHTADAHIVLLVIAWGGCTATISGGLG